jgi:4-amino-4-deoxy-L-arabinose transferase-like glycosyltransferase
MRPHPGEIGQMESLQTASDPGLFRKLADKPILSAALLALLAALLLLPGSATLPLMDRDEPRFAQATWEMREGGQWIIPYFNGEFRFDKPPLTYWWMGLHYSLFGKNELAARLHSIFAAWLTSVAILYIGRRFFSPAAGLLAAAGWLTCLQVMVHGRLAVADMPMILAVTLTMGSIARLLLPIEAPRPYGRWFWILTGSLAFGFLAKGPVAWAVPVVSLCLTRFLLWRKPLPWHRLQILPSLLLATAIVSLWGIPALIQTKGAFWEVGIGTHVVERGVSVFNGRFNLPLLFYPISALLSLLPWGHFAPAALYSGPKCREDLLRGYFLGWFIAPFLIFGLYATQLPHYILPGFPAFFLLLFREGRLPFPETRFSRAWFFTLVSVLGILGLFIAVGGMLIDWPEEMRGFRLLSLTTGGGLLGLAVGAPLMIFLAQKWQNRSRQLALFLALGFVLLVPAGFALGGRAIREMHPAVILTEQHWSALPASARIRACAFTEPSLVFYRPQPGGWKLDGHLDRALAWLLQESTNDRAAVFLAREWSASDAIERFAKTGKWEGAPEKDFSEALTRGIEPADFETRLVSGYNVARSSWVELLVVTPGETAGSSKAP